MEKWSYETYNTYGLNTIYLYYAGTSSLDKNWGTRNTLTMDGVKEGTFSGTSNQITAYRWNSCTIPTTDAVSGNAAEIRTMALATIPIKGTEVGTGIFWSKNNVENVVKTIIAYTTVIYIQEYQMLYLLMNSLVNMAFLN